MAATLRGKLGAGVSPTARRDYSGGGGVAPVVAYAAQGVQVHPDFGLKYAAGTLADALRVVIFNLWYAGPGNLGNPLYPDSRGSNNHIIFGSGNNVDSAETVPGSNSLVDNSAPNNSLYRFNMAALDTQSLGLAYGPNAATPGVPSNQWVADLHVVDVAHASGSKIGSMNRDGNELSHTVTQVGTWDAVTPIKLSSSDFWVNARPPGDGGIAPGEFWACQTAMWCPDATAMALLINADGTLKADAFARFFNVGVGPKDLLIDGSGPGIGLPPVLHELRPGETFDKYALNKGTAGNPTVIGGTLSGIRRIWRAPLDPYTAADRPYRAGFYAMNAVASGAMNDAGTGTGTYTIPSGYGQRIKSGQTLIVVWLNFAYDSGALRNGTIADQHGVAYTLAKRINSTWGELYCFTKLADANDETAQFAEWANLPIVTWTKGGGFVDGASGVMLGLYEGLTAPHVTDAQGTAHVAAATSASGYVLDAVGNTSGKGLMISAIASLNMAFEGNITPPASMDLAFKRGDTNKGGGWVYLGEERISAAGSTGTRKFDTDATGSANWRGISVMLENS